jgi:transcriptional regulator with XRE-family HTH domain
LADTKQGASAVRRPPVGAEIRRWRRTRNLTLAQIGERAGLNIGYLSQIENAKAAPSLDALLAIAAALDVPAAWLLIDSSTPPRVVRHDERSTTAGNGGTSRDLSLLEAVVGHGQRTGLHTHSGDEHHVILSGRFRMTQGDHVYELGPGDYLAWDPSVPHDVENIGIEPGRILMAYPRHARRAERAETRDGAASEGTGGH